MKCRALPFVVAGCLAAVGLSASIVHAQQAATVATAPLTLKKYGRRTAVWAKPVEGVATSSFDDNVSVEVERGAVSRLTHITVQRIVGHHDARIGTGTYEFGPRGQTFEKPVEICFSNSGVIEKAVKSNDACLGFFDERDKQWVCEDRCLETNDDGQVCGSTGHFTNFAILLSGGSGKEQCGRGGNDDYTGARSP